MRIVALVESEDHVCCRYRLAAYRRAFEQAGHTLGIRTLPRGVFGRLAIGRGLGEADAVILQRKLLPPWTVNLLRQRTQRLIFDFDDALWLRDSYSPGGLDDPHRLRRFRATVAACDVVVAGNEYLSEEAARYASPDRIVVIPTCVDAAKYTPSPSASRPHLQLVWVGSSSTLRGLELFAPTLSAIGPAVPGTRLKLICDQFIEIPDLPVDQCKWSEATEAAEIAAANIGIGWVPDDAWSRGKCGLKLLQYHAAGLPVVANPVGVQREIVRDGVTGYLATTTDDWVAAIARLAADAELRHRLGAEGRQQVIERYSVEVGARAWLDVLDRLRTGALRKTG